MQVIIDNLALCEDCTMAAVYNDYTALDYHYTPEEAAARQDEIIRGLQKLGNVCHTVREGDEFSSRQCDCCGTRLSGRREFFCVLGD